MTSLELLPSPSAHLQGRPLRPFQAHDGLPPAPVVPTLCRRRRAGAGPAGGACADKSLWSADQWVALITV